MLAALLALLANGCFAGNCRSDSDCSVCHQKSFSCHIKKIINIEALRASWERSFHKSLLKESFSGCPFLVCAKCHPQLADPQLARHGDVPY